jgi:hypothetical protein
MAGLVPNRLTVWRMRSPPSYGDMISQNQRLKEVGRATLLGKIAPESELCDARYEQIEKGYQLFPYHLIPAFKRLWRLGAVPDQYLEKCHNKESRLASDI